SASARGQDQVLGVLGDPGLSGPGVGWERAGPRFSLRGETCSVRGRTRAPTAGLLSVGKHADQDRQPRLKVTAVGFATQVVCLTADPDTIVGGRVARGHLARHDTGTGAKVAPPGPDTGRNPGVETFQLRSEAGG